METADRRRLWTRDFLLICMVGLLTSIVMQLLNTTLSIFVGSLGGNNGFGGLLATAFAVCAGIMRLVSGRLSDRHGRRPMMVLGSAVFALGVLACALVPVLPLLLLFRAVQGIGFAAVSTSSAAASASATFFIATDIGIGLGSALWGIVLDAGGFPTIFLGAAVVLMGALAYSVRAVRRM